MEQNERTTATTLSTAAVLAGGYQEVTRWAFDLLSQMQQQIQIVDAARSSWTAAALYRADAAKRAADLKQSLDLVEASIRIEARAAGKLNGSNPEKRADQWQQILTDELNANDGNNAYANLYHDCQQAQADADVAKLNADILHDQAEDACRILHGIEASLNAIAGLR